MIENVQYEDTDKSIVSAKIDGVIWRNIRLDVGGDLNNRVTDWIAAGNTPADPDPAPQWAPWVLFPE